MEKIKNMTLTIFLSLFLLIFLTVFIYIMYCSGASPLIILGVIILGIILFYLGLM